MVNFTPPDILRVSQWKEEQDAGWVSEQVSALRRREEPLAPAGNRTPTVQQLARRYIDRAGLRSDTEAGSVISGNWYRLVLSKCRTWKEVSIIELRNYLIYRALYEDYSESNFHLF
jgi:hypothetical protein